MPQRARGSVPRGRHHAAACRSARRASRTTAAARPNRREPQPGCVPIAWRRMHASGSADVEASAASSRRAHVAGAGANTKRDGYLAVTTRCAQSAPVRALLVADGDLARVRVLPRRQRRGAKLCGTRSSELASLTRALSSPSSRECAPPNQRPNACVSPHTKLVVHTRALSADAAREARPPRGADLGAAATASRFHARGYTAIGAATRSNAPAWCDGGESRITRTTRASRHCTGESFAAVSRFGFADRGHVTRKRCGTPER